MYIYLSIYLSISNTWQNHRTEWGIIIPAKSCDWLPEGKTQSLRQLQKKRKSQHTISRYVLVGGLNTACHHANRNIVRKNHPIYPQYHWNSSLHGSKPPTSDWFWPRNGLPRVMGFVRALRRLTHENKVATMVGIATCWVTMVITRITKWNHSITSINYGSIVSYYGYNCDFP